MERENLCAIVRVDFERPLSATAMAKSDHHFTYERVWTSREHEEAGTSLQTFKEHGSSTPMAGRTREIHALVKHAFVSPAILFDTAGEAMPVFFHPYCQTFRRHSTLLAHNNDTDGYLDPTLHQQTPIAKIFICKPLLNAALPCNIRGTSDQPVC